MEIEQNVLNRLLKSYKPKNVSDLFEVFKEYCDNETNSVKNAITKMEDRINHISTISSIVSIILIFSAIIINNRTYMGIVLILGALTLVCTIFNLCSKNRNRKKITCKCREYLAFIPLFILTQYMEYRYDDSYAEIVLYSEETKEYVNKCLDYLKEAI